MRLFVRCVFAYQRRRAKQLGIAAPQPAAVLFIQRFSSALLLHPHAHVLVPEGVFSATEGGVDFAPLPPPSNEEVAGVLEKTARRVLHLASSRFPEGLPPPEDAQAAQMAASVQTRLPLPAREEPPRASCRCALLHGFSLHANTRVHENDRLGLERLVRYGARGPLALERLSRREDGKLLYRLWRPAPDGSTHLVLSPLQLVKRLAALVVKPGVHLTRVHGAFAPHAALCVFRRSRSAIPLHADHPFRGMPIT